jgi:hypothetical protein
VSEITTGAGLVVVSCCCEKLVAEAGNSILHYPDLLVHADVCVYF